MTTQHKTLGEMLLSGDFAKSEETIIDGKHWQQVLDEAGYGLPDSEKPTQPKQPIDNIFDALRRMNDK